MIAISFNKDFEDLFVITFIASNDFVSILFVIICTDAKFDCKNQFDLVHHKARFEMDVQ